jgi:hypothetical protein
MNVSQPHLLANLLVKPTPVQKRTLATGLDQCKNALWREKNANFCEELALMLQHTVDAKTTNVIGLCKVKIDY